MNINSNFLSVNSAGGDQRRPSLKRTGTLLSNFSVSDLDEEKVISEALTTPYEKVIRILLGIKGYLDKTKADSSMMTDLVWVIARIQSHKLYTYEMSDHTIELEKLSKGSYEVKSFLDYLNNYSENKEIKRRNKKDSKVSKTTKIRDKVIENHHKRNSWMKYKTGMNNESTQMNKSHLQIIPHDDDFFRKHSYFNQNIKMGKNLKLDDLDEDSFNSPIHKKTKDDPMSFNLVIPYSNTGTKEVLNITDDDEFQPGERRIFVPTEEVKICIKEYLEAPNYDMEKILDFEFNIFEFENSVGRPNALPMAAKYILENFDLTKLITTEFLDGFLSSVRDGYVMEIPYHNDLHGIDVCQTVTMYLSQSNITEILNLTDYDILSMVIAALVHDIGHPGRNNSYQMNAFTDMAITYNDKSVLENYHISQAFRTLQRTESNIFANISKPDFKHIRKRMIESILATDMIYHAKIQSLVKNRLTLSNIKDGNNLESLICYTSQTLFDDQQEIINFLIHTADISHNSKDYKISYRWTYHLMDEFWKQGDLERSSGLPISFLCDRTTADVPKSQIGFIKGIIIPIFDILCDFMPNMGYYKQMVQNNIEEWGKIIEYEDELLRTRSK